jgi:hypothetical protein
MFRFAEAAAYQRCDSLFAFSAYRRRRYQLPMHKTPERPNQSLEPTATRQVNSFLMIKTFTPQVTHAIGSGGSAHFR